MSLAGRRPWEAARSLVDGQVQGWQRKLKSMPTICWTRDRRSRDSCDSGSSRPHHVQGRRRAHTATAGEHGLLGGQRMAGRQGKRYPCALGGGARVTRRGAKAKAGDKDWRPF